MILSEEVLAHWLSNGPFADRIDQVIPGAVISAPDVISMLNMAGVTGEERRTVVEDLCALGLRIEPTTIDHALVWRDGPSVSGAGRLFDVNSGLVYAWALAQHRCEDLAVMTDSGPAVVSISRSDVGVRDLEFESLGAPPHG